MLSAAFQDRRSKQSVTVRLLPLHHSRQPRSVAAKRGGGRDQSDPVMAPHPVIGQYWRRGSPTLQASGSVSAAALGENMRCVRAFQELTGHVLARPGTCCKTSTLRQRDTALSFDRRRLAATRGYLASEAQEALL